MAHLIFLSQIVSYVDGIPGSKIQPTPLVPSHIHANLMLIKKTKEKKMCRPVSVYLAPGDGGMCECGHALSPLAFLNFEIA